MHFKHFLSAFVAGLSFILLVHTQDQTGFISIDCGQPSISNYTDKITGIKYISDANFIDTGVSELLLPERRNNYVQQLWYLRYFPQGMRNCYTIDIVMATKYLIRASFFYGNFDSRNKTPQFDLHLGANFWDTVNLDNSYKEIIYVPLQNYVQLCLINTGSGTPYISAIELRPLNSSAYDNQMGALALSWRLNIFPKENKMYRYPDDVYDRRWEPYYGSGGTQLSTSLPIDSGHHNEYQLPSVVMSTAVIPKNASYPLNYYWIPEDIHSDKFYFYMHFVELEKLQMNQSRLFNITCNMKPYFGPFSPLYLYTTTANSAVALWTGGQINFSIFKVGNSTLPPLINALEIYLVKEFPQLETNQSDVDAIKKIKSNYKVTRNWYGDPCAPVAYLWNGIECTDASNALPRIIYLNLSSCGLTGKIASSISDLEMIEVVDLSNNSLTGSVPEFFSQLKNLRVLNLEKNKLTGSVPVGLIAKSNNEDLHMSLCGNEDLSASVSCTKRKKVNSAVFIVSSFVGTAILILTFAAIRLILSRRRNDAKPTIQVGQVQSAKRLFTYSEVVRITKNFERVLGKGGFGTVYHGYLDDTQVAVKMLSPSSVQGYQQFHSEVDLLMRVHHRNLTSLVGYCDDGTNTGLIYEYMANGNLQEHLLERRSNILHFVSRLQVAMDTAQGLEYLHYGSIPPILHRDVKTTNILLNEKFQAKLSDFGLSRIFSVDDGTHVSTAVAGTPGYLDPEYYITSWLNEKSDVYSYGVVLLEIITSRPAIQLKTDERIHISQWVSEMLSKGDIKGIVDPMLEGDFDVNSVWKTVEVAMACVSPSPKERPTMSQVVQVLKECLATELTRTKQDSDVESRKEAEISLDFTSEINLGPR